MMQPPRFTAEYPDYVLECEEGLEPALIAAIDSAKSAGWDSGAIWRALRSLVAHLEHAETENQRTDQTIEDVSRAEL